MCSFMYLFSDWHLNFYATSSEVKAGIGLFGSFLWVLTPPTMTLLVYLASLLMLEIYLSSADCRLSSAKSSHSDSLVKLVEVTILLSARFFGSMIIGGMYLYLGGLISLTERSLLCCCFVIRCPLEPTNGLFRVYLFAALR